VCPGFIFLLFSLPESHWLQILIKSVTRVKVLSFLGDRIKAAAHTQRVS
jgi:hypothetical protein